MFSKYPKVHDKVALAEMVFLSLVLLSLYLSHSFTFLGLQLRQKPMGVLHSKQAMQRATFEEMEGMMALYYCKLEFSHFFLVVYSASLLE